MNLTFESTPLGPAPRLDAEGLAKSRSRVLDPALREAFVAHGSAASSLDRLYARDALCVSTGQQPGLLTGPLFTIYKALSAVALSRVLEEELGRPVVPVFWVSGDDHDFAEANHLYLLTLANDVEHVVLRERDPTAPSNPLYREPLESDIDEVINTVIRATPETEFRSDVLVWLKRHYRAEQDFATAFAEAIAELMAPHGLVVFRSTHPAAKRAIAPHLIAALERAAELDQALRDRAQVLQDAGHRVPVPVGDGATLVMIEAGLGRDRLVLDGNRYAARRSQEAWTIDELQAVADGAPERLSPNVLLRPVVEAALLPTLAYVAGPGELAYLPQCEPVYEALQVTPQLPVPRWAGRVIESRVAKVLSKYGISAEDLAGPEGKLEASLVEEDMPAAAVDALSALRKALGAEYERLQRAAVEVDATLNKSVQSARNSALAGLSDIEKRMITHLKKQNDIVVQQLAKARRNLFPNGQQQERVLNVIPYLTRYGPGFLDAALEAMQASATRLETSTRKA